MNRLDLTVEAADQGVRIDRYLSDHIDDLSRSAATKLIDDGMVTVGEKAVKKNYKTAVGDRITVLIDDPQPVDITPEDIPLDIVYEDAHLLVVNKPKGMVVHPAPGTYSGTLVNAWLYHGGDELAGINGELTVEVAKAEGEKCERCWAYSTTVGCDTDHPTLCARCAAILK